MGKSNPISRILLRGNASRPITMLIWGSPKKKHKVIASTLRATVVSFGKKNHSRCGSIRKSKKITDLFKVCHGI